MVKHTIAVRIYHRQALNCSREAMIESGQDASVVDADGDGVHNDVGEGYTDGVSTDANGGAGVTPVSTDIDGVADYLDLDSDDDGIPDAVEAQPTANYATNFGTDGDVTNNDADGDGVIDIYDSNDGTTGEFGGSFNTPVNTDAAINNNGDTTPDYLDTDSDGDGTLDSAESGAIATPPTYADPNGSVNDPLNTLQNTDTNANEADYRSLDVPNTAPTSTGGTVDFGEDAAVTFTVADFNFADSDNDSLVEVRIDSLNFPAGSSLMLGNNVVNAGDSVAVADIPNLSFLPAQNASGANYASFTYSVNDGTVFSGAPATMTINGTPANDSPVGTVIVGGDGTVAEVGSGNSPVPSVVVSLSDFANPDTIAVSDLLAQLNTSDVEGDDIGIGVISADESAGVWQYRRDDISGHPWTDFQANDPNNLDDAPIPVGEALLFNNNTLLRFVPNPDFSGDTQLEFRVWDQTVGTPSNPPSTTPDDSGGAAPTAESSLSSRSFAAGIASDRDGDGVLDTDDLDDDNDGILDTDELTTRVESGLSTIDSTEYAATGNFATSTGRDQNDTDSRNELEVFEGETIVYEMTDENGDPIYLSLKIDPSSTGTKYDIEVEGNSPRLNIEGVGPGNSEAEFADVDFRFFRADDPAFSGLSLVQVAQAIDAGNGIPIVDSFGVDIGDIDSTA
ncbi:MAG: hypothetical protein AAFP20_23435, partial [Cyanobacteria bacterium J06614_10]